MTHKAKQQTTEEINQENYEYRELLIKLNIEEDLKSLNHPLDFLMYMLRDLAIISHDMDGNDEYIEFDWDDEGAKLDYLLDHLTSYKKMHRREQQGKQYIQVDSIKQKLKQHGNANPSAESILNYIRTKPNAS
jgi:hypothetical protein